MDNTTHDDVIDLGIASVETLGTGMALDDFGGGQQNNIAGMLAE
jgi:EAL domain-containing protein (putative c-di-GMP-specific phosphodiesterase class I)